LSFFHTFVRRFIRKIKTAVSPHRNIQTAVSSHRNIQTAVSSHRNIQTAVSTHSLKTGDILLWTYLLEIVHTTTSLNIYNSFWNTMCICVYEFISK
jgi:hypothetical protein